MEATTTTTTTTTTTCAAGAQVYGSRTRRDAAPMCGLMPAAEDRRVWRDGTNVSMSHRGDGLTDRFDFFHASGDHYPRWHRVATGVSPAQPLARMLERQFRGSLLLGAA